MSRRTSRYNDWKKASAAFAAALGDAGQHLSGWAKDLMGEAVASAINKIDEEWPRHSKVTLKAGRNRKGGLRRGGTRIYGGDHDHPWYTGILHDSVAGFVTDKNRVIGSIHYMPQAATGTQTYKGQTILSGRIEAVREANNASRYLLPGIQARFVVGVPYARKVDEMGKHEGYLSNLSSEFADCVEDFFVARAGHYWYNRTYVANPKKKK